MDQDNGAQIISITDEDGVEYELEVLTSVHYRGAEYLALTPADASDEEQELEVSILKSVEEDGEPLLIAVEDEQELETVYNLMMDAMYEEEESDED